MKRKSIIKQFLHVIWAFMLINVFFLIAIYARFFKKNRVFDIALGPLPLINNIYHKKALEIYGYTSKTLIFDAYFITNEFDYIYHKITKFIFLDKVRFFYDVVTKYKVLYTYFDGTFHFFRGLPSWASPFLKFFIFLEPRLYRFAKIKLVVMPYGSDVHDMNLSRNLLFKNNLNKDYPKIQKMNNTYIRYSVMNWLKIADHVISGCDWVYYMHSWDTLLSGHFSIDTKNLLPKKRQKKKKGDLIKIFHSPNHVNIKGTRHFEQAINSLKKQGYNVELVFVQKVSNKEVLNLMNECDIVADQLIIGWYAMTALEAMSLAKPVLCYLEENLIDLYVESGVLEKDDLPFVNCNYSNLESQIKMLLDNPDMLELIGNKSRAFVEKYHSLEFIGSVFDKINRGLGVEPRR